MSIHEHVQDNRDRTIHVPARALKSVSADDGSHWQWDGAIDSGPERSKLAMRLADLAGFAIGAAGCSTWGAAGAALADDSMHLPIVMLLVAVICAGVATGLLRIVDTLDRSPTGGAE